MSNEPSRTLAYICPKCRQTVIAERTIFSMAAAPMELPCPCGKSYLRVDCLGDRYQITVPCVSCGGDHRAEVSTKAFTESKCLGFSCHVTGMDCCYIGEEAPVFAAARRLEGAADQLKEEKGSFLNEIVMHEVLEELKEIAQRDGISCTCGSHKWQLKISYAAVDVICAECGSAMRIPAATDEDITDLCCKPKLLIQSVEG